MDHNALRWDQNIVFGGFKQSGIGREGGVEGLLPFLEAKLVLLDGMPSQLQDRRQPKQGVPGRPLHFLRYSKEPEIRIEVLHVLILTKDAGAALGRHPSTSSG